MPDYGHPIRFGTFLTPVNDPPTAALDAALRSEELGFDLATFQDHPYQPAFHDTWTLVAWVASRTSRIRIAGNVFNAPLRQPAVLARAAVSLDLLSEGRLALGLGAGGFTDAIASMGAPLLTAGQSVTALGEAIDVIRGIWDTTDSGPLHAGGKYHHVDGAKRGPAPAHPIPIWVGAFRPRSLRQVGAKADGWLPTLGYMQYSEVSTPAAGNQIIDAAAIAAGRDPRDITRLLNVAPNMTAKDLTKLALDDGVSTFIVPGDDPRVLAYWAANIIPAVRDAVVGARESS